jgi:tripartite-type tricarboxylate transporter receptor subunit TctC
MNVIRRRQFLHLAAGAAALPGAASIAIAQSYPSRPINLVVPFAAGGPSDAVARVMAEGMRGPLGQTITIENVAGAGGSLGAGRVARATPDGYTLLLGLWGTHVVNPVIYNLTYDVTTAFAPIALICMTPHIVAARKSVPANDLNGFVGWLKADQGKASAAHSGAGSPPHVALVLFQKMTGTDFRFIPYRGAGPAMQDLVAGQVDFLIDSPVTVVPQLRAGMIKAYAVTEKGRVASAPEIPTVDDAGLPGLYLSNWFALYAPRNTPSAIIDRLNAAAVAALAEPSVRARFAELGQEIFPRPQQTPGALAVLQRADTEKWQPIIKAANIKGE